MAGNESGLSVSASATTQSAALSGTPTLFFSDITSGPRNGAGDGLGSGAIVTIWGKNLGFTQGTSKVYFKDSAGLIYEAAYVYYWTNADGKIGGPADLYTYQKMQEIAFSIPVQALYGTGEIYIEVGGTKSNILPFTIRTGNIYYVKIRGSDTSGDGSWNNPWATMEYVGNRANRRIQAGDIIYIGDGVQDTDGFNLGTLNRDINGTQSSPISLIAYPGAKILVQGRVVADPTSYNTQPGIFNYYAESTYWNFSKFVVKTQGQGINTFKGARIIGNEITDIPGTCAEGVSGAIGGNNLSGRDTVGNIKAFGNYIHDFGCDTTSLLHHVFYISNRSGVPAEAHELAWNFLKDNGATNGLHEYDDAPCGDYTGTLRIHDNVVVNQRGSGIDTMGSCFSMPVEIYNNLLINTAIKLNNYAAIYFSSNTVGLKIKVYNNTIYGYGDSAYVGTAAFGSTNYQGTWEWKNNIVVDTKNIPFVNGLVA